MIGLGSRVRDRVTGAEGQVLGRTEYLYSAPRLMLGLAGIRDDGTPVEPVWLEEARCEVVQAAALPAWGFGAVREADPRPGAS